MFLFLVIFLTPKFLSLNYIVYDTQCIIFYHKNSNGKMQHNQVISFSHNCFFTTWQCSSWGMENTGLEEGLVYEGVNKESVKVHLRHAHMYATLTLNNGSNETA